MLPDAVADLCSFARRLYTNWASVTASVHKWPENTDSRKQATIGLLPSRKHLSRDPVTVKDRCDWSAGWDVCGADQSRCARCAYSRRVESFMKMARADVTHLPAEATINHRACHLAFTIRDVSVILLT